MIRSLTTTPSLLRRYRIRLRLIWLILGVTFCGYLMFLATIMAYSSMTSYIIVHVTLEDVLKMQTLHDIALSKLLRFSEQEENEFERYLTLPVVDEDVDSMSTLPVVDIALSKLLPFSEQEEKEFERYLTLPVVDEEVDSLLTLPVVDEDADSLLTLPVVDEDVEGTRMA